MNYVVTCPTGRGSSALRKLVDVFGECRLPAPERQCAGRYVQCCAMFPANALSSFEGVPTTGRLDFNLTFAASIVCLHGAHCVGLLVSLQLDAGIGRFGVLLR